MHPHATRTALAAGGTVTYVPRWLADHERWLERLVATLPFEQPTLTIAGTTHPTPRLTSFHGDPGCVYRYSRRIFEPREMTLELTDLRQRLQVETGQDFNSTLVNYYRDGRDSMGFHADDEPELGPGRDNIVIASISLGAPRRFVVRTKRPASDAPIVFELGEGDLLVMEGTMQQHYRHGIPKTARPVGRRLNLTFRVIDVGARGARGASVVVPS